MIDAINFSNSGSLAVQSGRRSCSSNSNGSLGGGICTPAAAAENKNSVNLENGATINGSLVIPAAIAPD